VTDVVVKTRDGKIIGGQERFLTFSQRSRYKVQELMLNMTLTLDGVPPGDYVVAYTIRDLNSTEALGELGRAIAKAGFSSCASAALPKVTPARALNRYIHRSKVSSPHRPRG